MDKKSWDLEEKMMFIFSYFQTVIPYDAEEWDDCVQDGQNPQRGLHVATAFFQDIMHCNDSLIITFQAAQLSTFTSRYHRNFLFFCHSRGGDLFKSINLDIAVAFCWQELYSTTIKKYNWKQWYQGHER